MEIDSSPVIVEVGDQMLAQLVRVNPGTTTGTTLSLVQRQRQLAIRSTAAFDIFKVAIRAWFPAALTNGLNEYGGWLGPPTAGRSLRGNLLMWQGVLKVQFGRQVPQPVIWKGKKKRGVQTDVPGNTFHHKRRGGDPNISGQNKRRIFHFFKGVLLTLVGKCSPAG